MNWKHAVTSLKVVKMIRFDGSEKQVNELIQDDRFCLEKNDEDGTFLEHGEYNKIYLTDIPVLGGDTVFKDDYIIEFENGEVITMNPIAAGFLFTECK